MFVHLLMSLEKGIKQLTSGSLAKSGVMGISQQYVESTKLPQEVKGQP